MDENRLNGIEPEEPTESAKVEEAPAEEMAEPAVEPTVEEPTSEQPQEAPAADTPPQWQGGYAYQNPNPYQNYGYYYPPQPPRKKDKAKPFIIAAATAGIIMLVCCVVISAAVAVNALQKAGMVEKEDLLPDWGDRVFGEDEPADQEQDVPESQRDDTVIYNAPDITTEKKTGEELSLNEIYKKVKDSVVAILISMENGEEAEFSGSGFIISKDGYIISNHHVIEDAKTVKVILSDGITEYSAKIVGSDAQSDLAVLKVDATGLSAAQLGDSDELEVGETVAAIGNPYGMELFSTMHNGIVSALNRKLEIGGTYMTLIQTNALINPGNSGGPLVNAYGQVVGITSSKLVADGYEGIGFAIPLNEVTGLVEELINYGYIKTRAYIGIQGSDLTKAYASYHGLPQGVYVVEVDEKCDAAKKGLKKGDVIIGFAGEEVTSMADLTTIKDSYRPGDQVTIKVWREKKEFEITITLTEAVS